MKFTKLVTFHKSLRIICSQLKPFGSTVPTTLKALSSSSSSSALRVLRFDQETKLKIYGGSNLAVVFDHLSDHILGICFTFFGKNLV
ncbi:hypothetical protein CARUB_v10021222mg [Capsella rubella]|uniref:Uncharacterized protein n=1 Tax=Capsella rubella TaxID=81985 RepID=R0GJM5_9BRAS|nr:hypothetical protein CARUB_v10021222mg [Capsella rubella]